MGTCGRVNLGRLERLETYRVTLPRAVERKKEKPLQELNCFKSQRMNMIKTISSVSPSLQLSGVRWFSAHLMPAVTGWFSSTCSGTGTFHLCGPLRSCWWFPFKAVWSIPSQKEAETCNYRVFRKVDRDRERACVYVSLTENPYVLIANLVKDRLDK